MYILPPILSRELRFVPLHFQSPSHRRQSPLLTKSNIIGKNLAAWENTQHACLYGYPAPSRVEQSLPGQYVSPLFSFTVRDPACKQGRTFRVGHDGQDSVLINDMLYAPRSRIVCRLPSISGAYCCNSQRTTVRICRIFLCRFEGTVVHVSHRYPSASYQMPRR